VTTATRAARPVEERGKARVHGGPGTPPPPTERCQVYQMGERIGCQCPRVVTWRPAGDDHRLVAAFVSVWHREECAS